MDLTQKLNEALGIEPNWISVLSDVEKQEIKNYQQWTQNDVQPSFVPILMKNKRAIELLYTLDEILPFMGNDKYEFSIWFDDAVKKGLLTTNEKHLLTRFCIDQLRF